MKTLYLLRHAKSDRDLPGISDFDRPLAERGYADAHFLSKHLFEKKISVDVVLTSPAIRAMSTALIFSVNLKFPVENILIRRKLYDTSLADYISCIDEIEKGESVLLAGHNNTISEMAQKLSSQRLEEMKTCGVVALQFDISSWKDIVNTKGKLIFQLHPALVKGM